MSTHSTVHKTAQSIIEKWQAWSCRWRVPFHLRMVLASLATSQKRHSFSVLALLECLSLALTKATKSSHAPVGGQMVLWSHFLRDPALLLITHCFTLNTEQHNISPKPTIHPHRPPTLQCLNRSSPRVTVSLYETRHAIQIPHKTSVFSSGQWIKVYLLERVVNIHLIKSGHCHF